MSFSKQEVMEAVLEDRIVALEKKISFLEDSIETLTETVSLQHKNVEQLQNVVSHLKGKVSQQALVRPIEEEEPPPHY